VADARMETKLEIIHLTELDADMLARLARYGRDALGESALDEWMLPVIARYGLLFVGAAGGEIVGSAEVIRCMGDGDLYLEGLYIRPEHQRMGYGTQLLEGVMKLLAGKDFIRLLVTLAPDNDAGRSLYGNAGFSELEYLPVHYGPERDRLLLAAQLGSGARS